MAKRCGNKPPVKGRPNPKPRGVAHRKSAMRTLDVPHRSHKHVQGIVYNGAAKNHTAILGTGSQKYVIGMGGWEIIKRHNSWIYSQGVNILGTSKAGRLL